MYVVALRNKDGTPYRLRGPDPIKSRQRLWDRAVVRLHNLKWAYRPFADGDLGEPAVTRPKPKAEPRPSPRPEPKPEISPMDTPAPPEVVETLSSDDDILADIPKVVVHCLPVVGRTEHKDDLYGQSYSKPRYGNKFAFEAVMLDEEELGVQLWTTATQVTVGSILYPMNRAKKWWRVTDRYEKTGGYVVTGVLSDFNPSFEE